MLNALLSGYLVRHEAHPGLGPYFLLPSQIWKKIKIEIRIEKSGWLLFSRIQKYWWISICLVCLWLPFNSLTISLCQGANELQHLIGVPRFCGHSPDSGIPLSGRSKQRASRHLRTVKSNAKIKFGLSLKSCIMSLELILGCLESLYYYVLMSITSQYDM